MNIESNGRRARIVGLDIFRIKAVLFVFLYHSNMHFNCNYGVFSKYISMGSIYMTAFFLLSGFSMFLAWSSKNLSKIGIIKQFYIKRLISILPLYYSAAILFIVFQGKETMLQNVIIAPVEMLGLQMVFSGLFGISHNIGTWFVSCILMCYLVYPLIQETTKQVSLKSKVYMIILLSFILLYSPIVVYYFNLNDIYSNPFFRIVEFFIGTLLCSLLADVKDSRLFQSLFTWRAVIIECLLLFICVTYAVIKEIEVGNSMLYSWIALPLFMLQIFSMAGVRYHERLNQSRVVTYLCEISYAFFLAQGFCWGIAGRIIELIGRDSNTMRIATSLLICFAYAVLLHELLEKPIASIMKKKLI